MKGKKMEKINYNVSGQVLDSIENFYSSMFILIILFGIFLFLIIIYSNL